MIMIGKASALDILNKMEPHFKLWFNSNLTTKLYRLVNQVLLGFELAYDFSFVNISTKTVSKVI